MIISLIAAMGNNRVIGINNSLPWRLPADMARFKSLTVAKPVLMGRATYESIGKPLFGRTNIIISHDPYYKVHGCFVVNSIYAAIELAESYGHQELMVIGGAFVYEQMLPIADRLYLTIIDKDFDGDAWFPEIRPIEWTETDIQNYTIDPYNHYRYTFVTLQRQTLTDIDN